MKRGGATARTSWDAHPVRWAGAELGTATRHPLSVSQYTFSSFGRNRNRNRSQARGGGRHWR
eukprot:COSAG05_NODE_22784_length_262_cov_0.797546_1_plen_61_part_01